MDTITARLLGAFNKITTLQWAMAIILVLNTSMQFSSQRHSSEFEQSLIIRIDSLERKFNDAVLQIDSLNKMHPWRQTSKKMSSVCNSTILGKLMWGSYSRNLHISMVKALEAYNGPKICVNSTIRHWNKRSAHGHGKAIDLKLDDRLLEWLISDEGLV